MSSVTFTMKDRFDFMDRLDMWKLTTFSFASFTGENAKPIVEEMTMFGSKFAVEFIRTNGWIRQIPFIKLIDGDYPDGVSNLDLTIQACKELVGKYRNIVLPDIVTKHIPNYKVTNKVKPFFFYGSTSLASPNTRDRMDFERFKKAYGLKVKIVELCSDSIGGGIYSVIQHNKGFRIHGVYDIGGYHNDRVDSDFGFTSSGVEYKIVRPTIFAFITDSCDEIIAYTVSELTTNLVCHKFPTYFTGGGAEFHHNNSFAVRIMDLMLMGEISKFWLDEFKVGSGLKMFGGLGETFRVGQAFKCDESVTGVWALEKFILKNDYNKRLFERGPVYVGLRH